jgi:hypothetical protein
MHAVGLERLSFKGAADSLRQYSVAVAAFTNRVVQVGEAFSTDFRLPHIDVALE